MIIYIVLNSGRKEHKKSIYFDFILIIFVMALNIVFGLKDSFPDGCS